MEQFDEAVHKLTGFHVDQLSPIPHAHGVTMPTLLVQVHDDFLTKPSDMETIFEKISASDKKLFWIEGTDQRFQGYNYFSNNPAMMIEWFDDHAG